MAFIRGYSSAHLCCAGLVKDPFLFLILENDLPNALEAMTLLYADDIIMATP